ncbi:MAG: SDR family NAD(P)-dependent oxidoreductase [Pseudobacter sp.]|uniref:SDR family NAD(P)-dependent oxidoreductase n=1 Tax=Pseudobacter sp. TaxID=2045420 RepID=UPI003F7DE29B
MSYALVTGAAKGIGRAISAELAKKGYHLLLVDIDQKRLPATAEQLSNTYGISTEHLILDLSLSDAAQQLKDWSQPWQDQLNVVVNNAGFGLNGAFESIPLAEQLNIIDVNVKAQLQIAHAFIPVLKQFNRSWLLNVGSTTCYQSVPFLAIYAASKAFVISFTRSLRYELKDTPVSVSCLIPGSTDTDFVHRARMGESIRRTADKFNMSPEEVGRIAVKGLFNNKAEIIPGFTNKLNAWLPKFFPKLLTEKIAAKIYQPEPEKLAVEPAVLPS